MIERPDFTRLLNLAQPRLGAEVMSASDDFFADKSRLIKPEAPVFVVGKYDDHGKWMDGWESRRRRTPGHDHAILKLGQPGRIFGFEVDTTHFTGNFPPFCSIDAAHCAGLPVENDWVELVGKSPLKGNQKHYYSVTCEDIFTHIRLNIYPDGGVARLRVYGEIAIDWSRFDRSEEIDLAALEMGGRVVLASDAHFGVPENLIAPGKGVNMGDGWETRRRPDRGTDPDYWTDAHDFCILALGHKGVLHRAVIETTHFKGNYPDRMSLQAIDATVSPPPGGGVPGSEDWPEILPQSKLGPDDAFSFDLSCPTPVTHVRLNIYPDGGVSRLRLYGRITD